MRIRAFPMTMDDNYVQSMLSVVKVAIQKFQRKEGPLDTFEELYKHGYTLTLHRHGQLLYDTVKDLFYQHLKTKIRREVVESCSPNGNFFQVLGEAWRDHEICMALVSDILAYLDRVYVVQSGLHKVTTLGHMIFRDEVIKYDVVRRYLATILVKTIMSKRRGGQIVDGRALKNFSKMLMDLGIGTRVVYREIFEEPLLQQSANYYESIRPNLLADSTNSAFEYLRKIKQIIDMEVEIVQLCLDESTVPYIVKVVEEILIRSQMVRLLEMENSMAAEILQDFYTLPIMNENGEGRKHFNASVVENIHKYAGFEKIRYIYSDRIEEARQNDETFIRLLVYEWYENVACPALACDIMSRIDETIKSEVAHLHDVMLVQLKVIEDTTIHDHLCHTLLNMVTRARAGEKVDSLKLCCNMLMLLGDDNGRFVYETLFEKQFLQMSASFYKTENERLFPQLTENENSLAYIQAVEGLMNKETELVRNCLDESTESKLVNLMSQEFFKDHMTTIVALEMDSATLILIRLYSLFSHFSGGPSSLANITSPYFYNKYKPLIVLASSNGHTDPVNFVNNLWKCKDEMDNFLINSFYNDIQFEKMMTSNFEYLVNLDGRAPEYLSLYIDTQFRTMAGKMTETEMDLLLDKTIALFQFLHEKDLFEHFYRRHMTKRLLHTTKSSLNSDLEHVMVSKLMATCGFQFTSKLEGMLKDLTVSSTTMEEFNKENQPLGNLDNLQGRHLYLSVLVLNSRFWPLAQQQQQITCNLPSFPNAVFENFKRFYLAKYTGRHLKLLPQLGSADLIASFLDPPRRHTLQVSTYQMCILMLFNNVGDEGLSYQDIKNDTDIPSKELSRAVMSLAMGKPSQRILVRKEVKGSQVGQEIDSSDLFFVNSQFTSKSHRVKIQTVKAESETTAERKETLDLEQLEAGRRYEIEAAIVRIMKARKTLSHSNLVTEVQEQLQRKFVPQANLIKTRIEALIDRDYLARTFHDRNVYMYVA